MYGMKGKIETDEHVKCYKTILDATMAEEPGRADFSSFKLIQRVVAFEFVAKFDYTTRLGCWSRDNHKCKPAYGGRARKLIKHC